MSINNYVEYSKDNPKGLWFKARWYGWGWVPVTWQGWAVLTVFVVLLVLNGCYLDAKVTSGGNQSIEDMAVFYGATILLAFLLIWICYKKGEKPHWSWGDPRKR